MASVDVIMTVFNGEKYLSEAIDSVLRQTHQDLRLIVVDDASRDGTKAIVEKYRSADPRLHLLVNERNLGISAAMNRALKEASADFLAVFEQDDVSAQQRLARQLAFLERNPEIDVVGSRLRILGTSIIKEPPESHADVVSGLCFNPTILHPSAAMRRRQRGGSVWGRDLLYDEKMTVAADYDLWVKLGELGARFANIPEPLVDYRVHPNSLSRKRVGRKRAEARRIRRRQLERLGIDPTRREVRLHDSIAEECVGGIEHLRHSAAWLRRLESANARTGVYPSDAFARLLGQRWYILCRKSLRTAGLHALGAYLWTSVGRRPPLIYLGKTLLWDESGKWRRIYRRSEP